MQIMSSQLVKEQMDKLFEIFSAHAKIELFNNSDKKAQYAINTEYSVGIRKIKMLQAMKAKLVFIDVINQPSLMLRLIVEVRAN